MTQPPQIAKWLGYAGLLPFVGLAGATLWLGPVDGIRIAGAVPSLLAWIALLIGTATGLWLVAVGLWICFAVDRKVYPRFGLRSWLPMRLVLTLVATLACALTAWSLRA